MYFTDFKFYKITFCVFSKPQCCLFTFWWVNGSVICVSFWLREACLKTLHLQNDCGTFCMWQITIDHMSTGRSIVDCLQEKCEIWHSVWPMFICLSVDTQTTHSCFSTWLSWFRVEPQQINKMLFDRRHFFPRYCGIYFHGLFWKMNEPYSTIWQVLQPNYLSSLFKSHRFLTR